MPITLHKPYVLYEMDKQELLNHIDDLTEFIEIFIGEDIQALANQIRDLKKENKILQSNSVKHYDDMEKLIEKESKNQEMLFNKSTKRNNKIKELKEENEKLKEEIEQLKFNLDGMTCDRDAKEEEINNMIENIDGDGWLKQGYKTELSNSHKMNKRMSKEITELKEEIRILKQYQKDDNLKRVISLKEKDNEELSEKLDKSIEESQKWQDKYYTLKSSIQQFKNSLNNLE